MSEEVPQGSVKCENCGAICPASARWCPSCGRQLPNATGSGQAAAESSADSSVFRLVAMFALIVIACFLVWKFTRQPGAVEAGLAALFLALPGRLLQRLQRTAWLVVGMSAAACVIAVLHLGGPGAFAPPIRQAWTPDLAPANVAFAPGKVIARFKDAGEDPGAVRLALGHTLLAMESEELTPRERQDLESTIRTVDVFVQVQAMDDRAQNPLRVTQFAETMDPDTHDVTIEFDRQIPADGVARQLSSDPGTVFAEPDAIYHTLYTPDDPYYDEPYDSSRDGKLDQWYLRKIDAPRGWDKLKNKGSHTLLAIIDTGIDYNHPDLKDVIARNSKGEIIGKSFVNGKPDPLDDNGHGTHCAGIADASTDNGVGVAGVGFNSFKIVPVKVMTHKGYGELGWICRAITWAADHGCRVESLSLGGSMYSQGMQDAINYAWSKGVIVVAAAGNEGRNNSGYPASNNRVVAVSATDENDQRTYFSNFGRPISVGAPGIHILATLPCYPCELTKARGLKEGYDSLAGTSMACPVVSGAIAALLAYHPSLTATEAIQRVEQTADNAAGIPDGGWGPDLGHGRINLGNAIDDRMRSASVGSFYGQVTNRFGTPVADAVVSCGDKSARVETDGMFRFANFPPGEYTLTATRKVKKGTSTVELRKSIVKGADATVDLRFND